VCTSRRRKAEALLRTDGDGGNQLALPEKPSRKPISADLPALIATTKDPRSRISEWLAHRALDASLTNKEIARRMGLNPKSLNTLISRATLEGWLVFDDPLSRIQHQIIPKTIDNLNYFLDRKDKTVTIEVAKGTVFRQFQAAEGIQDNQQTVLALKIEMPESLPDPEMKIVSGVIVGRPRAFDE
jgi:hypothetical protein